MKTRFILLRAAVSVGLFTFLSNSYAGSGRDNDYSIVPGVRIGPIELNVPSEEYEKRFGEGVSDAAMGRGVEWWPGTSHRSGAEDFTLFTLRNTANDLNPVKEIGIVSSSYHTAKGISKRSTVKEIWHAFPHLIWQNWQENGGLKLKDGTIIDVYDDQASGIVFHLRRKSNDPRRVCYGIMVHLSDEEAPTLLMPEEESRLTGLGK